MKKIILSGLVMAVIGITFIGCSKKEVKTEPASKVNIENVERPQDINNYNELSISNKVLVFGSFDSYTSIVDSDDRNRIDYLIEHVNNLDFNSFNRAHADSDLLDNDDFLEAILDENSIVKIDEWFIKINLIDEVVTALKETEENAYANLLLGESRNIRTFSTGDDVIDHLENNTSPDDRGCGGVGGGTYSSNTVSIGDWNTVAYVKFFRAGIWFRLTAGNSPSAQYEYNMSLEVVGTEAWRKKRPCNGSSEGTSAPGIKKSGSHTYAWQFYGGTRNLNGYYFYVRLKIDGPSTLYTNWCGRNINSPY